METYTMIRKTKPNWFISGLVNLDYENQKVYYLYTHLIDREALPISINKMDKSDLQYLALSAYLISVSEVIN